MRVLFICENYYPHIGGAEVVFKNLAERFALQKNKVAILTHQLPNTPIKEVINGVKIHRLPCFHSRYWFTFLAILPAIKLAKKADLIQTTTFNGAFPAWIASKITGKPVVITVHEVWINKWKKITEFSWLKCLIHELLERSIYLLNFNRYICVSQATLNDLIKLRIKKKRIKLIRNGFDYQAWNPNNWKKSEIKGIRKKYEWKNNFVYFSWGRPGPTKGFEYLIQSMVKLKKIIPPSHLILMLSKDIAYQKKRKQLLDLIQKLKAQSYIQIVDSAPNLELGKHILAADCIVIPSVSEGFGYTTLETVSLNKPIIVSDAGSLPEVVSKKHLIFKTKSIADLTEKMVLAYNGKYNFIPEKKFSWEESVNQYLKTYHHLIKK